MGIRTNTKGYETNALSVTCKMIFDASHDLMFM